MFYTDNSIKKLILLLFFDEANKMSEKQSFNATFTAKIESIKYIPNIHVRAQEKFHEPGMYIRFFITVKPFGLKFKHYSTFAFSTRGLRVAETEEDSMGGDFVFLKDSREPLLRVWDDNEASLPVKSLRNEIKQAMVDIQSKNKIDLSKYIQQIEDDDFMFYENDDE